MLLQNTKPAFYCTLNQQLLPQSLKELGKETTVTDIGQNFEEIALTGTQFEDALITTQNNAALITGRGGYGALQTTSNPLRLSRSSKRVDVRFSAVQKNRIVRSEASTSAPASITVFATNGQVRHRVQYVTHYDQRVAQSLNTCPFIPVKDESAPPAANVISLAAIRAARDSWQYSDIGQHLNDYLIDDGQNRARVLPHIGPSLAWQIQPRVLTSFLEYLCKRHMSHAKLVFGGNLAQADVGKMETLETFDTVVFSKNRQNSFSIDTSKIGSAWVTVHASTWLLEIFDTGGLGAAVLAADPLEHKETWNELLCSLPQLY